jgi:hypothetical protein
MTLSGVAGIAALASLQGTLVALPKANALERLIRLRSPAWAVALPGSIVVGTFGITALPPAATGLVLLASIATPVLSSVAALGVVRGPRAAMLPIAVMLLILAETIAGETGQVSASILTALGCSTVGMALVRLIPQRFILIGVLCMCVVDITLLAVGVGRPAAALMTRAEAHVHHGLLDHATVGGISIDYPDLVLAALLGGAIAGRKYQRRAAVAVTMLAAAYGMLLPLIGRLPATVPPAIVFVVLAMRRSTQPSTLLDPAVG